MQAVLEKSTNRRQMLFFALLVTPLFMLMFVVGAISSALISNTLPIILAVALIGIIICVVTFGINWRIGLYALMFFILWDRWLLISERGNLNATKIIIGLTIIFMATAIVNRELTRWWEKLIDPLALVGICYVLITIVSLIWTHFPEIAGEFVQRRLNVIVLLLLLMVAITDRDILHKAMLFFMIGGIVTATIALSELFLGKSILEIIGRASEELQKNTLGGFGDRLRIVGPSGDPTFWGLAISAPGVLMFGMFFYYKEWWKKVLLGGGVGIVLLNILSTGARGGALSFIAGCATVVLFCPIKHKVTKLVISGGLLVLITVGTILISANAAATRIADPTRASDTVDFRVANMYAVWDMYETHPFTGTGVNSFQLHYPWYRLPGSDGKPLKPHNAFLQILVESGLLGALIYSLLYVAATLSVACAAFSTHDRRLKFEATALFGTMFGFFLFAGTSNVLENELYFLVFGLCGATYHVARQEHFVWRKLGKDFLKPEYKHYDTAQLVAEQNAKYPRGT